MIRINLLGEKVDRTGVYVFQGFVGAVALFVALVVCFLHYGVLKSDSELVQETLAAYQAQLARLSKKTKEVEGLEAKQKVLQEKLMTIAKLKANKQGPVYILSEITRMIPERAWLTLCEQEGQQLNLEGVALDGQTVSEFMTALRASEYFGDPDLAYSQQGEKNGVKIQNFAMKVPVLSLLDVMRRREKGRSAAVEAPGPAAGLSAQDTGELSGTEIVGEEVVPEVPDAGSVPDSQGEQSDREEQ